LSRFCVVVDHWPEWNQTVTVHTWPRTAKSVFAMRDFEMLAAGTRIGAAASAWLILDAATRKPLRSDRWLGEFQTLARRSLPDDPPKLPGWNGGTSRGASVVAYTDIDVNAHVNNTRYIGWMLDAYPMTFHQQHSAALLEVNFLGEARCGDTLETWTMETGSLEGHHCIRSANGEEICRARILWRPD
jgi:acyl-ACP thioesterase